MISKSRIFCFLIILLIAGPQLFAQVNYDEASIPFYTLPEILTTEKGERINSTDEWERIRRPEVLQIFKDQMFGEVPDQNLKVSHTLTDIDETALEGKAIRKNIQMLIVKEEDSLTADLLVYLPVACMQQSVPVFLGMNFYGNHTIHSDPGIPVTESFVRNNEGFFIENNRADDRSRGVRASRWPVEKILERGYGLAVIYYGDIDPDYDDNFQNGLHALLKDEYRDQPEKRSSISAWAWSLTRAMDYFERDKQIDHKKVIVIGHSRLGKASLWAGASDPRFAMVISNNSGCGGAALSKRAFGETVKAINDQFPHWFSENFKKYNDNEQALPFDQHMLLGLIAPRPVYVASAEGDQWADPTGEYLSLFHAGPVYALYRFPVFESEKQPGINHSLQVGRMGYHIRSGKHDITDFDWEKYMDFADVHVKKQKRIL